MPTNTSFVNTWNVASEFVVNGVLLLRDATHLQSDRFRHALGLIGKSHRVTIDATLLPSHQPCLELAAQTFVCFERRFLDALLLNERACELDVVVCNDRDSDVDGFLLLRRHVSAESDDEILQVVLNSLKRIQQYILKPLRI